MSLWDGRFAGEPSALMREFGESLSTDLQMWAEDLAGSTAHATMLEAVGLLTAEEGAAIRDGLRAVGADLAAGWQPDISDEDIHMAVERRLHEHIGSAAGKLHTARSRNDQVATDVRLWLRTRLDHLDAAVAALISALVSRAERDGRVLVPGYTHLQRGQPIWLAHQLLAHAWSLARDRERIADARRRVNRSPLGAAAMAGTPHPIDRQHTATLLDFDGVIENAMDAVSARDHVIEAVSVCAICASHLSRLAEELIIGSSREFSRLRLSDDWSTGSSIMPQKRNPDAAELVRGKTGRVTGALVTLLTLVKALPLAYNRDLQEDRPALFDAVSTTLACVRVLTGCVESMTILPGPNLEGDALLATEIADFLATAGVPFRHAHRVSGRLVADCEARGIGLHQLTDAEFAAAHTALTPEVREWLRPESAAERRTSRGGTAWSEVLRQVALLRSDGG